MLRRALVTKLSHETLVLVVMLFTGACGSLGRQTSSTSPPTQGEGRSSHTYIPLDPFPVVATCRDTTDPVTDVLRSLPDQTVRMAVGEYDRSGTLTFGPVTLGLANQQYQVVLDYVNSDVTYLPLYITRLGADQQPIDLFTTDTTVVTTGYRVALNEDFPKANPSPPANPHAMTPVVVPLYVGLGLRLMSTVTVGSANANLSSLGALAAEAEAGNVTGTLVVQTLGVTGRPVSTALPLPSELNRTAVSNAILALGAIKASLFDSTTVIAPRVVGVYNPIGGDQALVSGIISTLASSDIPWEASCSGEGA